MPKVPGSISSMPEISAFSRWREEDQKSKAVSLATQGASGQIKTHETLSLVDGCWFEWKRLS